MISELAGKPAPNHAPQQRTDMAGSVFKRHTLRLLAVLLPCWSTACASPTIVRAVPADTSPGPCRAAAADRLAGLDELVSTGQFRIRYSLEGADAVDGTDANGNGIPDAIDDLTTQLTAAQDYYVQILGLTPPLSQPRYQKAGSIEVLVKSLPQGNGVAFDEVTGNERAGDCFLSINVSNKLQFNRNVTPAHELFHLFQYGYAMFKSPWYLEGMARWMEEAFAQRAAAQSEPKLGCRDVLGETYAASRYWRQATRAAGQSAGTTSTTLSNDLRARTYLSGEQVVVADPPVGSGTRLMLESLKRLSGEISVAEGLPMHNWPEALQKSDRFDALMCDALDSVN